MPTMFGRPLVMPTMFGRPLVMPTMFGRPLVMSTMFGHHHNHHGRLLLMRSSESYPLHTTNGRRNEVTQQSHDSAHLG